MDSSKPFVVGLSDVSEAVEAVIGSKANTVARLARAGFRVPQGFCITTHAYQCFLKQGDLQRTLQMELGRKPLNRCAGRKCGMRRCACVSQPNNLTPLWTMTIGEVFLRQHHAVMIYEQPSLRQRY